MIKIAGIRNILLLPCLGNRRRDSGFHEVDLSINIRIEQCKKDQTQSALWERNRQVEIHEDGFEKISEIILHSVYVTTVYSGSLDPLHVVS